MKTFTIFFFANTFALVSCTSTIEQLPIRTYFSPKGGAEEAVVNSIEEAQSEILVQAYSLTSEPIINALIQAHKDSVDVRIILDRRAESQEKEMNGLKRLKNAKINIKIDTQAGKAHNKVMVIDSVKTITGSYNYSQSAEEKNRENLLIINDRTIAMDYLDHWNMRDSVSRPPKRRHKH